MKRHLRIRRLALIKLLVLVVIIAVSISAGAATFAQEQQTPQIYVVTSQDRVNARACPQITCAVVVRFAPGAELTVIEIVQGDPVNGSDEWLHVSMDGVDAYVHGSLAALVENDTDSSGGRGSGNATTYLLQGKAYLNQSEYARAIAEFDEYIRLVPDDAVGYANRGLAYFNQGEYEQALADYNQAILLDPEFAEAYSNRGDAYLSLGNMAQAMADVTKAIQIDPDNPLFYLNRGYIYSEQEEYEQAVADFDEAIRLDPNLAYAYFRRAEAYISLQEIALALTDLNMGIELAPENAFAYFMRAVIYREVYHENALALADLNEFLRLTGEAGDPGLVALVTEMIAEIEAESDTFTDDFSDNSQGWDTDQDRSIQDGVIHVEPVEDRIVFTVVPDSERSDFSLTADAFAEPDGLPAYGIWFRFSDSGGYLFLVSPEDGYYSLQLLLNGEWQDNVIDWRSSRFIKPNAVNQLGIVANGDQITLYINGVEVDSITDTQLETGYIGLAVTTFEGSAPIQFDNLFITSDTTYLPKPVDCADTGKTGVPQAECEALVAFYESTNGAEWENNANWNASVPVRDWYGVTVGSGHVTTINLHGNLLTGSIPDLSAFTHLRNFDLSDNQLSGNIPDLSALTELFALDLSDNLLSGNIPDLSALTDLSRFDLSDNQLSGTLPDMTTLTRLFTFDVSGNQLVSEIPSSITETAIAVGTLTLCGGDNQITSSDPNVIAWVEARDRNWTQGCE